MTYRQQRKTSWSKEDIRSTRRVHLKPVLESLGYRLRPLKNGNYEVCGLTCTVVIKANYWICTDNQRAGNVIDFCMQMLNMSFSQAMEVIKNAEQYDANGYIFRSDHGKSGGFIQL